MKTFKMLSFLFAILFVSCTISTIEDFVVGENFINDNTGIMMIDTLTIKSSTVLYDSIISNSSSRFLIGSNYNSFSGYKNSNTFMEMKFDDDIDNTKFVFDSLKLVLNYDTYYFGDTTVVQTITVHQLQEEMVLGENGYLYTTSKFNYNSVPLGSISLKPRPNSHQEVSIKLSDKLGKRLSKMIMAKNDTILSSDLFSKFFNGLVIRSQSEIKGAVLGFRSTDSESSGSGSSTKVKIKTKPEIRLYYHLSPNPESQSDLFYKFSYNSDGINFNQISGNTSNSLLDGITDSGNERCTVLTEGHIFVQSGIQVFSKFRIPYVDNLLRMGKNSAFVGATLRLYPIKGTYSNSAGLPDSLYVYSADLKNKLTTQITVPGSTTDFSYARLNIIKDVEETVYYEIDVSNFVGTELTEELETNRSLMVGFGSSVSNKSANYLVLGGINSGKYAPVLNVYYYHN